MSRNNLRLFVNNNYIVYLLPSPFQTVIAHLYKQLISCPVCFIIIFFVMHINLVNMCKHSPYEILIFTLLWIRYILCREAIPHSRRSSTSNSVMAGETLDSSFFFRCETARGRFFSLTKLSFHRCVSINDWQLSATSIIYIYLAVEEAKWRL